MPRFRVCFEVHLDVEAANVEEARALVWEGCDDLVAADTLARAADDECPESKMIADALDAAVYADEGARIRVVELDEDAL